MSVRGKSYEPRLCYKLRVAQLQNTPTLTTINSRTRPSKYPGRYNYGLWTVEPDIWSIIGYTVVIPVVSALGIIGNSLILAVHLKAKTYLKASTYTYLAGRWRRNRCGHELTWNSLASAGFVIVMRRDRESPVIVHNDNYASLNGFRIIGIVGARCTLNFKIF